MTGTSSTSPLLTLNNGVQMPALGLGMFHSSSSSSDERTIERGSRKKTGNRTPAFSGQQEVSRRHHYTEEQKKQEPTRSNTGLFFLRGKPGAPFAVVSPGGGFSSTLHPFMKACRTLSRSGGRGYNAFVLKYRVGSGGALATRDQRFAAIRDNRFAVTR